MTDVLPQTRPATELAREIARLQRGEHLCLIYEDRAQHVAAVVPFVQDGLTQGERCLYIADDLTPDAVRAALGAAGVDVPREEARRALVVVSSRETSLGDGTFQGDAMLAYLETQIDQALADGFAGLRPTGEMTALLGHTTLADLLRYEACLNRLLARRRTLGLCQYSRQRFPPEVFSDVVLRTHPKAVIGGSVCPNLYYEPPEMILAATDRTFRTTWMIEQLKRAHANEQAQVRLAREQQAVQERERLLAMVAHDLKTPLAVLQLNADLLLRTLPVDERASRWRVGHIRATTERMTRFVRDLLDLARIRAGKLLVTPGVVDVEALVADCLDALSTLAADKNLHVRNQVPATLPPVAADPNRIQQVLSNLVGNAIAYTPPDGTVTVSALVAGGEVVVAVHDTGPGIPATQLTAAFDGFWQGQAGLARGTGLGLTIAKGIVEAHGGRIWADSTVGEGSTFRFTLPAVARATIRAA